MAGSITEHHQRYFTNANLIKAYQDILALFDKWAIEATFAFVMAFTLSKEEFRARADLFRDVHVKTENWLRHFRAEAAEGVFEGWFVPEAFERVRAAGRHEIACHGFSHLPLAEDLTGEEDARHELAAALEVARAKGVTLKTFVYPRNQIGYVHLLREHGFSGYRERLPRPPGPLGKITSFLTEFNVFTPAQSATAMAGNGITAIPPGYFLNWRFGLRRVVPVPVTVARWRHIIAHAVHHGGVAHLWFHPHNIIDGPETLATLDRILALVAARQERGELEVLTQEAYCARLNGSETLGLDKQVYDGIGPSPVA
ncbi:MAG TPA: polysaccharide deacetylase family protein [Microvirga sp.]|nr:polysaccharide deacetylase family protein [Microvirga sp.]